MIVGAVFLALSLLAFVLFIQWQNEDLDASKLQQAVVSQLQDNWSGHRAGIHIKDGSFRVNRDGDHYMIEADLVVPRALPQPLPGHRHQVMSLEFDNPYMGSGLPFEVSGYQGPIPGYDLTGELQVHVTGVIKVKKLSPYRQFSFIQKNSPKLTSLGISDTEQARIASLVRHESPSNATFDLRSVTEFRRTGDLNELQRHHYTLIAREEIRRGALDSAAGLLVVSIMDPPHDESRKKELMDVSKSWRAMYEDWVASGRLKPRERSNLARFHDPIVEFITNH